MINYSIVRKPYGSFYQQQLALVEAKPWGFASTSASCCRHTLEFAAFVSFPRIWSMWSKAIASFETYSRIARKTNKKKQLTLEHCFFEFNELFYSIWSATHIPTRNAKC